MPGMMNKTSQSIAAVVVSNCKLFCKHSSLHGMYYIHKASHWLVYVTWVMIVALSMGLCFFLGHMIWQKYIIDPTLTVIETTHYSVDNIEFPAVTVCDTEKVYLPKTQKITELLALRGYNQSDIIDFYKSLTDVQRNDYEPTAVVKKMHSVLDDLGYTLEQLLDMFKRSCSDMLANCNWRSVPYNCSQMFKPVQTIVGHCCQFDITYFRENTDVETNLISGTDVSEALDITVLSPTEKLDIDESDGYAMLYVYDREEKLTLIDSYVNLTPESYYDVNVYTWVIDSSDNVKALSLASRKCILNTDKGISSGVYQTCMTRLILKNVVDYCRCLPFNFTSEELDVEEYSECAWDRLICVYQSILKIQVSIKEIISESECYQRCDYAQYNSEVELIKHHKHLSIQNQSASRVQVHFAQTTCIKYRREILYTWDQMLANLGGIFGLCLGGSIISVIELIWFSIELIFAVISSYFKKSVVPKEKNQMFIVSQTSVTAVKPTKNITFEGKYKFIN